MTKWNYKEKLEKIDLAKQKLKTKFLREIPFLKNWTELSLIWLNYEVVYKTFSYNQLVIWSGEKASFFIVVWVG